MARSSILAPLAGVCAAFSIAGPASAAIHLVQIEQVIGGVNGDVTEQAIQLRQRSNFQNFTSAARLRAWDAQGLNPVMIIDFTTNVPNGNAGARILITSPNFNDDTLPPTVANFTMTNLIPASYLAAGSLTFESDGGLVYWRLSWGGAAYTGPCTGTLDNDPNGNFCPPYPGPLPSNSLQALQFQGPASAPSSNNAADYALTAAASTWVNNAGSSFVLFGPAVGACCFSNGTCGDAIQPSDCSKFGGTYQGDSSLCANVECSLPCPPDIDNDNTVGVLDLLAVINAWGAPPGDPADVNGDGSVDVQDLLLVINAWGPCP